MSPKRWSILLAVVGAASLALAVTQMGRAPVESVPTALAAVAGPSAPSEVVIPPCASEDDANCFWDAAQRGNGVGTDFVDYEGQAYYPEPRLCEEVIPADNYNGPCLYPDDNIVLYYSSYDNYLKGITS